MDMALELKVAAIGLIGAVVGGALAIIGQQWSDRNQRYFRKRSIAHAVASEIEAYIDLMDRRGHVGYARDMIAMNKTGTRALPKSWISGFEKGSNPFPILSAMLPEIGILDSLSSDVTKFYSQATAIRLTLMSVDEGVFDEAHPSDLAHIFQEELDLWLTTVDHGKTTIRALRLV